MKILLWPFIYFPSFGGVEVMVRSLALEWTRMGHTVVIFTDDPHHGEMREGTIDGITVYYFPFSSALSLRSPRLIKEVIERAAHVLQAFGPDRVSLHGLYEFFAFFQLRILKNIPYFLTIHGPLEEWQYCRSASCLRLWSMAQGINTVSYAMHKRLTQEQWIHPRFHVIHNGVSPKRFPTIVPEVEGMRIAMVGRFTSEKCFDLGFRAFQKVHASYPEARLCLAGRGEGWDYLVNLRSELGLEQAIEMPGFVPPEEIHSIIDKSNLVWVPSLFESFGLVAIEAALRSRAVVASRSLGLEETVEDGVTGVLIEPKNIEELATATLALFQNSRLRKKMGERGKERAERLFSIEESAEKYLELFG